MLYINTFARLISMTVSKYDNNMTTHEEVSVLYNITGVM